MQLSTLSLHCSHVAAVLYVCRCEPSAVPLCVAVLVSGGVDSSLALQLVAAAGHKPTAFYLQVITA
jgi:tRNA-specific 2-thiouridylase